jgi:hypothetical protein
LKPDARRFESFRRHARINRKVIVMELGIHIDTGRNEYFSGVVAWNIETDPDFLIVKFDDGVVVGIRKQSIVLFEVQPDEVPSE